MAYSLIILCVYIVISICVVIYLGFKLSKNLNYMRANYFNVVRQLFYYNQLEEIIKSQENQIDRLVQDKKELIRKIEELSLIKIKEIEK